MVLSLTKISLSLIKYLHSPNPAILTFVNYAVSAPILISKQPIPSPPPLSTLNLTTVKGVFRAVGTGPCPLLPQTGEKNMRWLHMKGLSAQQIHLDMKEVLGDNAPSQATVYRWTTAFICGRIWWHCWFWLSSYLAKVATNVRGPVFVEMVQFVLCWCRIWHLQYGKMYA